MMFCLEWRIGMALLLVFARFIFFANLSQFAMLKLHIDHQCEWCDESALLVEFHEKNWFEIYLSFVKIKVVSSKKLSYKLIHSSSKYSWTAIITSEQVSLLHECCHHNSNRMLFSFTVWLFFALNKITSPNINHKHTGLPDIMSPNSSVSI